MHLLQIWLLPNRTGVEPGYAQQHFADQARRNRLALLVSPDGRDGSIAAHQDGLLYGTVLDEGVVVEHRLAADRRAYLHVARGAAKVCGELMRGGDGARIDAGDAISIEGVDGAEVLLFDLP